MNEAEKTKPNLHIIPSVDRVLNSPSVKELLERLSRPLVLMVVRETLDAMRKSLSVADEPLDQGEILDHVISLINDKIASIQKPSLCRVINGTGIVIHTNLGRAPLAPEAIRLINEVARGYSNLEYDLAEGKRGKRNAHIQDLILRLTEADGAYVVNNNAGAVLLALNSIAEGKEAVVSRGELVEIGGSFRIPDVMRKSGAIMKEVGTTNRTHLSDYENAITDNTALLLKVHTSNYRIVGFSAEVSLKELVELGGRRGIPVMMDLGSGNLTDISLSGLKGEPVITEILSTGVDVITFSGDKLLGGPQAGVILTKGARVPLSLISQNSLARALRIDKLTLAGLEATLLNYQKKGYAASIPALRMINLGAEEIKGRAERCLTALQEVNNGMMELMIKEGVSSVGGGSLPTQTLPTFLVGFRKGRMSVDALDTAFRTSSPAVVGRIQDETFLLDLRTIQDDEIPEVRDAYKRIAGEGV